MKLTEYLDHIDEGKIPPEPPEGLVSGGWDYSLKTDDLMSLWNARRFCTNRGLWIIIDQIWTKQLAEWIGKRTCLEIMAGAGWLSKSLHDHGVTIRATDDFSWEGKPHSNLKTVFNVEKLAALSALKFHQADILVCSWPPYDDMTICDVCEKWGEDKPIIYIGEGWGGCCAPEKFWQHFKEDSDLKFPMKSWDGIHDYVYIGNYMTNSVNEENDGELSGEKFADESGKILERHGFL